MVIIINLTFGVANAVAKAEDEAIRTTEKRVTFIILMYGILAIRLFTFLADQALAENGKYVFQKIRLDLRVLIITFSKFSFHSFQRCTFRVLQGSDNHSSVDSVSVSFGQEYSFSSQGKI